MFEPLIILCILAFAIWFSIKYWDWELPSEEFFNDYCENETYCTCGKCFMTTTYRGE